MFPGSSDLEHYDGYKQSNEMRKGYKQGKSQQDRD